MARLIRTEKEVEGRREEVWLVVDEDALEQWPAGPRNVVGRPATRNDGLALAPVALAHPGGPNVGRHSNAVVDAMYVQPRSSRRRLFER